MLQQFGLVLAASALVGSACLLNPVAERPLGEYTQDVKPAAAFDTNLQWIESRSAEEATTFQGTIVEVRELRDDDQAIRVGKAPNLYVRIQLSPHQSSYSPCRSPVERGEVAFAVEGELRRYSYYLQKKNINIIYLAFQGRLFGIFPMAC